MRTNRGETIERCVLSVLGRERSAQAFSPCQNRPGQPFWDTNSAVSPFTTTLPDILRIKPGGLSFAQTRVYEEFGREGPRLGISRPSSANFVQDGYDSPSPVPEEAINYSTPATQLTHQQCMERFAVSSYRPSWVEPLLNMITL